MDCEVVRTQSSSCDTLGSQGHVGRCDVQCRKVVLNKIAQPSISWAVTRIVQQSLAKRFCELANASTICEHDFVERATIPKDACRIVELVMITLVVFSRLSSFALASSSYFGSLPIGSVLGDTSFLRIMYITLYFVVRFGLFASSSYFGLQSIGWIHLLGNLNHIPKGDVQERTNFASPSPNPVYSSRGAKE